MHVHLFKFEHVSLLFQKHDHVEMELGRVSSSVDVRQDGGPGCDTSYDCSILFWLQLFEEVRVTDLYIILFR